jgi:RNA polymerase sigma-70 factor (sigma-E family)
MSGQQDAASTFTAYFSARRTWLRGVAYMLCQDWHRADDLLQTTAIRLYARWGRAGQIENLDAYVRRILVNAYLAELRSPWWKRVIPHWEDVDGAVAATDPAEALDLRAALGELPPRQRATVILRYYDELSVQETADVLRCSPGTVKSQTARALATLRRTLSDGEDGAEVPTTINLFHSVGTGTARAQGSKP